MEENNLTATCEILWNSCNKQWQ